MPVRARLRVSEGDIIEPGTQITEGPLDPKEVLNIQGVRACQRYLVDQVQEVYRSQGVDIHDKHIELIVRQMLRRVRIVSPGEGPWLPAELVDSQEFRDVNKRTRRGRQAARRGPPRTHGYHQGVARDGLVAVGSIVPGDDEGPHRGLAQLQVRTTCVA